MGVNPCLRYGSHCSDKTPLPKATRGRNVLFGLWFQPLSIVRRQQGQNSRQEGTWRQKLSQRPWRNRAHWLALLAFSVCFPIQSRALWLEMVPPTVSPAFPHQWFIKKMPHRLTPIQSDGGALSADAPHHR